jgi:putative hydrolase of the HAD superfamily
MTRKSIPNLCTASTSPGESETGTTPIPHVVFFDVGDTLVAPHPSFGAIFVAACREVGLEVSDKEAEALERRVASELAAWRSAGRCFSVSDAHSRRFWQGLYGGFLRECGHAFPTSLPGRIYECFRRAESYRVFPDVVNALGELRGAGLLLGVISNWEDWLERLLAEVGLLPCFSLLLVSGVEGKEKPDPEIFHLALARAGVPPELALHVGDSPESDCAPALAAGMQAVLLDRRGHHVDTPYRRVTDLTQLTAWLRRRSGGGEA